MAKKKWKKIGGGEYAIYKQEEEKKPNGFWDWPWWVLAVAVLTILPDSKGDNSGDVIVQSADNHSNGTAYQTPQEAVGRIFENYDDFDYTYFVDGDPESFYIFYAPTIGLGFGELHFHSAEYCQEDYSLVLIKPDGRRYSVGARINMSSLQEAIAKANTLYVIRTENQENVETRSYPLSIGCP